MRRWPYLFPFAAAAITHLVGGFEFFERYLTDSRFGLLQRPASGQVVLVEIDEQSLRELNVWPWPRRHYAEAIRRIVAADPRVVALDLDLSSRSNPKDDRLLAEAFRATAGRVILPVFEQFQTGPGGTPVLLQTTPNELFRDHVGIAGVNVRPGGDGLVRKVATRKEWNNATLPTLPTALSGRFDPTRETFVIDFGIRPETIPKLSFADILKGRADVSELKNRIVIIGATAVSLGDMVAVPVHAAIPGAVMQALATESLLQERALERSGTIPPLLISLLIALLIAPLLDGLSWKRGLAITVGTMGGALAVPVAVQAWSPIMVDSVPALATTALGYLTSLIRRIDQQGIELWLQRIAARRSELLMRMVADNAFDGMITVDGKGKVQSLNTSAERIFARQSDETVGMNWQDMFDSINGEAPGEDLIETGTYEATAAHKDGAIKTLEIAVNRLSVHGLEMSVFLVHDTTQRKAAEAAANDAKTWLSDAVESVREGFALFDNHDRLVLCNLPFRALHAGLEVQLRPGLEYAEFLKLSAQRKHYQVAAINPDAWRQQRLNRHCQPKEPFEEETVEGSWYLINEQRTERGGTVLLQTDITDIKRRELELTLLAHNRDQVTAAIEATTAGIVITGGDENSSIVYANPAFTKITGYPEADVLGRPFDFLEGPETDPEEALAVKLALMTRQTMSVEVLHYRKDGTTFWNHANISPVLGSDGSLAYCVWIIDDITSRKRSQIELISAKEEAERASRMKSEFLAAMSHELRTPLNAVIGLSEMLRDEAMGPLGVPQYTEFAHTIHESGSHLLEIINDILDMAKIEAGQFELNEAMVSLSELIPACVRMVQPRADERGLQLDAMIAENLPNLIADERVVRQIVVNLLSNSVKFTPEHGNVSISAIQEPGGSITIATSDTGIGMTEEQIEIALEPFKQIDSSLSREYEGTGLGLALARQFIAMHDGTLKIESEQGAGTTVLIHFPAVRVIKQELKNPSPAS